MFPFNFAAGDTGCRSVQSLTCSASSGTAGDVGITLLRRVATIPLGVANITSKNNIFDLGKPVIYDNACIAIMVLCNATNTGLIQGQLAIAQG
jgi:hypothetical protein